MISAAQDVNTCQKHVVRSISRLRLWWIWLEAEDFAWSGAAVAGGTLGEMALKVFSLTLT